MYIYIIYLYRASDNVDIASVCLLCYLLRVCMLIFIYNMWDIIVSKQERVIMDNNMYRGEWHKFQTHYSFVLT